MKEILEILNKNHISPDEMQKITKGIQSELKKAFIAGRDMKESHKANLRIPRTLPSSYKYPFFDDYLQTNNLQP